MSVDLASFPLWFDAHFFLNQRSEKDALVEEEGDGKEEGVED